jgi:hypothetical protein
VVAFSQAPCHATDAAHQMGLAHVTPLDRSHHAPVRTLVEQRRPGLGNRHHRRTKPVRGHAAGNERRHGAGVLAFLSASVVALIPLIAEAAVGGGQLLDGPAEGASGWPGTKAHDDEWGSVRVRSDRSAPTFVAGNRGSSGRRSASLQKVKLRRPRGLKLRRTRREGQGVGLSVLLRGRARFVILAAEQVRGILAYETPLSKH